MTWSKERSPIGEVARWERLKAGVAEWQTPWT